MRLQKSTLSSLRGRSPISCCYRHGSSGCITSGGKTEEKNIIPSFSLFSPVSSEGCKDFEKTGDFLFSIVDKRLTVVAKEKA